MTTTILLLDSDDMLRGVTASMLARRGARVTAVATVEEALSQAAQRIYDVAILDVTQGAVEGPAILEALRKRGATPRAVVLCSTQAVSPEIAAVFTKVLEKPFAFDKLVGAALGRGERRRPTRSGIFPRYPLSSTDLASRRRFGPSRSGGRRTPHPPTPR